MMSGTPSDVVPTTTVPHPAGTWSRRDWLALADRLLAAARPHASPGHALITFPGPPGGYGRAVDGLEGFARTFLLAGFRVAGARGEGVDELVDWYAAGIAAGTDPTSSERWVRLDEHPQAKVEAASLALILDLTRPWLWDRLPAAVQERVVRYLAPAVGDDTYPRINWVWFRLLVQTFLRSVGGPYSLDEMAEDLATHDSLARPDGWMSDGPERAYDHYVGWALHLYPTLWARMAGAADLAAGRRDRDRANLDRFLRDAVALVGADGSPLIQGRSLIYRFAAAAPFWVGAIAEVPSVSLGQLRRAATQTVRHFVTHGAPDADDLLTLGWHRPWPRLAQHYSGPGSPYWACKGLLGIALSDDHPVWRAPEQPLPVEESDTVRALRAPGWLISATRSDGIVRVVNHGTDHADEGASVADSPLYSRLGYSTVTSPVLDESGWLTPLDQSVTLVDGAGRATHRAGMRLFALRVGDDGLGVAGSRTLAHWVDPDPDQRDHGSGRGGRSWPAGHLTVYSLVRGPWELRLARIEDLAEGADATGLRLVVGGWAVPDGVASTASGGVLSVTGAGLTSRLENVLGTGSPGTTSVAAGGPLGDSLVVPWLAYPARTGTWIASLVELSGGDASADRQACRAVLDAVGAHVTVDWPDGLSTTIRLDIDPTRSTG
ncbi:hypothetical protein SAMN05443287_108256 [Micromonospora phaseoli]|uniref:DUF2264 domain-containing protein n=1 Tax=Micromonospora phaseoli TaxID=1144548 RepID=A0A1H7C4J2_9ACTN|nr:DUF2264 domain-containing protein [Micromonospora phaseoli]PZV92605.1 hypothetical protein CLV64_11028 [Micromonospora phaseoli]GIJ76742.1 hypothetical protein Xph01_11740 [Micromonospora phaseoli]SEJ84548.1 hypothetical protein SAMN05443287_108256 [Micromonospora phaseoli]